LIDPVKLYFLDPYTKFTILSALNSIVDGRQFYCNLVAKDFKKMHAWFLKINRMIKIKKRRFTNRKPHFTKSLSLINLKKKSNYKIINKLTYMKKKIKLDPKNLYFEKYDDATFSKNRFYALTKHVKQTVNKKNIRKVVSRIPYRAFLQTVDGYASAIFSGKLLFYPPKIARLKKILARRGRKKKIPHSFFNINVFARRIKRGRRIAKKPQGSKVLKLLIDKQKLKKLAFKFSRGNVFTKRWQHIKNAWWFYKKIKYKRRFIYKVHYKKALKRESKYSVAQVFKKTKLNFIKIRQGFCRKYGLNVIQCRNFFRKSARVNGKYGNIYFNFTRSLEGFLPVTLHRLKFLKNGAALQHIAKSKHIFINKTIITSQIKYLKPGDLLKVSKALYRRRCYRRRRVIFRYFLRNPFFFCFKKKFKFFKKSRKQSIRPLSRKELYLRFIRTFPKTFQKLIVGKLRYRSEFFDNGPFYFVKKLKTFIFCHHHNVDYHISKKKYYTRSLYRRLIKYGADFKYYHIY